MKKQRISVTTRGIHGPREYVFYDAVLIVNMDTRGILFSGQGTRHNQNARLKESKFVPLDMITKIEIENYDGGLLVCNDMKYLVIALDVFGTMPKMAKELMP